MMNYAMKHLKQPSTWRGVFMLLGLFGYVLSPELQETIIGALIAVLALIEVIRDESKTATSQSVQQPPAEIKLPPVKLVGRSHGSDGMSVSAGGDTRNQQNSGFGDQS